MKKRERILFELLLDIVRGIKKGKTQNIECLKFYLISDVVCKDCDYVFENGYCTRMQRLK